MAGTAKGSARQRDNMIKPPLNALQEMKAIIRNRQRDLASGITSEALAAASDAVMARIQESELFRSSRSILFYAAIQGELRLERLMSEAILAGKRVALPRFDSESARYVAAIVQSLAALQKAQFGILEPAAHAAIIPMEQLDLALVPGVAFDCGGGRLGRGKGFYDRLLESMRAVKCGVALDHQIEANLPREPHDLAMNCIVTPSRWINVAVSAGSK
jgi:5-formyltetrahydrofolate cyclo-ligase